MEKKRDMLVVMDMVNGFFNEGPLAAPSMYRIVPVCKKYIEVALERGDLVVAFEDCHEPFDDEFEFYPAHCIRGTRQQKLIDELKEYEPRMTIIEKNTTNGFYNDQFQRLLASEEFGHIKVVGCCTDICVENFVESLAEGLRRVKRQDKIQIPVDGVDTFDHAENDFAPAMSADYINKYVLKSLAEFLDVEILPKRPHDPTDDLE